MLLGIQMLKDLVLERANWTGSSSLKPVNAHFDPCTHCVKLADTIAVISAISDFTFSGYPVLILWKVQMKLKDKVALCCLMGVGILYVYTNVFCLKALCLISTIVQAPAALFARY